MKQIEHLKVGTLNIKVERKKIKNMYLKIKPNGEIVISAHPDITSESIIQFVKSKQSWIFQKQRKREQSPSNQLTKDEILFLGQRLKCVRKFGVKTEAVIEENLLVIYGPSTLSEEKKEEIIQKWLFKQLQQIIRKYHQHYWPIFQQNGFQPLEIKYRQMKSTWGVCRPTKGTITYSKQLIHQPETFIQYVVVHELCHLLQPNHSTKFYEAVAAFLPQWKEYSKNKV